MRRAGRGMGPSRSARSARAVRPAMPMRLANNDRDPRIAQDASTSYQHADTKDKNFREFPLGYKQLLELCSSDPAEIMKAFGTRKFNNTINNPMKPDIIVLFLKCLINVCDTSFDRIKSDLLVKICKSPFIKTIEKYIMELPYVKITEKQFNWVYWNNMEEFWINLFKFYNCVIDLSPTIAVEALRRLIDINKMTLEGLQQHQKETFSSELLNDFENIQVKFAVTVEEIEKKTAEKLSDRKKPEEDVEVPDDFREIEILPSAYELTKYNRPFLRPCIIDGVYQSPDHYLDVQFRLMREDYISTMRDSIRSYIKDKTKKRYEGGRFYQNVIFTHVVVCHNCIGITVIFNKQIKKKNPKAFYRRFLFGSLLVFTDNNFQTLFFGTVVDRDEKMLLEGKIVVDLINVKFDESLFKKSYIMFESDVFYPQYGPVLSILQNFKSKIPMQDHIIYLKDNTKKPEYLTDMITVDNYLVNIENDIWPSHRDLNLDRSQFEAYKTALTREFVTIQGPPGTGKTYLGLKIASTILKNVSRAELPIFVLCYTNHALDQFLEGLLHCTREIVRIGGQSRNENFADKYNIKSLRKSSTFHQKNPYGDELQTIVSKIKLLQKISEMIFDAENITDYRIFKDYLADFSKYEYQLSYFDSFDKDRGGMINWLLMSDRPAELKNFAKFNQDQYVPESLYSKEDFPDIIKNNHYVEDFEFNTNVTVEYKRIDLNLYENHIHAINELCNKARENNHYQQLQGLLPKRVRLLDEYHFLKRMLNCVEACNEDEKLKMSPNMTLLNAENRWALYMNWNAELKSLLQNKMNLLEEEFRRVQKLYDEQNFVRDSVILKNAHVVGVTTTAAARIRSLLLSVAPRIVVVEEAAEVLECHVIANISDKCEHVILIGDHQQLRPSTATYYLGRKFNLEISLFERMFVNSKNCCKLGVQHRMRSEISKLITPSIYEHLEDHASVLDYDNVEGVTKNLFFINHEQIEEEDEVISSKRNPHEAHFLLALAKYLIQQGYAPHEITILVTYSAQLFYVREIRKSIDMLQNVHINVLDNFQGEENRIILLSLVRNNIDGKIGFLDTVNRVCVALSRAKEGFYIMGNMNILMNKNDLWKKINNTLIEQESIGEFLTLQCQNHGIMTQVKCVEDFNKVSEGGCNLICNKLLPCSHNCLSLCHVDLDDHADYKCRQKCIKMCAEELHPCHLLCFQTCLCKDIVHKKLECGHSHDMECHVDPKTFKCPTIVQVKLERCSHELSVKCCNSKGYVKCTYPCIDRLICGHVCRQLCHKDKDPEHLEYNCKENCVLKNRDCSGNHMCLKLCYEECDECTIRVAKKRSNCGHSETVSCYVNVDTVVCKQKCKRTMSCGHHCQKMCVEPCDTCRVKVKKMRSCNHILWAECSQNVEEVKCDQICKRLLKCGHECEDKCNQKCGIKKCLKLINNPFKSLCGHSFQIPCFYQNEILSEHLNLILSKYCTEPCGVVLKDCKHTCSGTCGRCLGRLHAPCGEPCGLRLVCGHFCDEPCRETCGMCQKPCEAKCSHSKCNRKCGIPCPPCMEKCLRQCQHQECKYKCGNKCSVEPCSEPCEKTLKCSHKCIGLCGEECPKICRICNADEMPEEIFGTEYDENSRYIQLMDCQHIFEVNDLDHWVDTKKETKEIAFPPCPLCKIPIVNTGRYLDYAKETFNDIQKVKRRIFGGSQIVKIEELKDMINDLSGKDVTKIFLHVPVWQSIINKIQKYAFIPKNNNRKRQMIQISEVDVENCKVKVTILSELVVIFVNKKMIVESDYIKNQVLFILNAVSECRMKVSQQQIDDFNNELTRTKYLVELYAKNAKFISKDFKEYSIAYCDDTQKYVVSTLRNILIFSTKEFNEETRKEVEELFKRVSLSSSITDAERRMVVKAMDFRQGHWYKCPNGHPYCIDQCGGAMEVGKCPECREAIGGKQHKLLPSNSLASEMDGATHAAYSDIANQEYLLRRGFL